MIRHSSHVLREYHRYVREGNADVCYLRHPSGVTVVVLKKDHAVMKKKVKKIEWNTNPKKNKGIDRSKQSVIGKRKKGGLFLQPETRLCIIQCEDDTEYHIRAGIRGRLVEVNQRLSQEPELIQLAPENQGYLAILMSYTNEKY
ncbi:hypothetical protein AB6A40_010451 [Gnathostoma spinigerum]|uniref:Protein Abitram n=1 Tax=Gnathostoma spinigerum TaxID=75299 RepID=A0ABD6EXA8_9BILA